MGTLEFVLRNLKVKVSLHTLEFELREMGSKVSLHNLVLDKVKKRVQIEAFSEMKW